MDLALDCCMTWPLSFWVLAPGKIVKPNHYLVYGAEERSNIFFSDIASEANHVMNMFSLL